MKKVLLGLGAALIVILLLLQTNFQIYDRFMDEGYAVTGESVKQMLSISPDEEIEITEADMIAFSPLEFIYSKGNDYYLGEKKKTEIDLSFPMIINGGSGVLFVNGNGTLFDDHFEKLSTYAKLRVVDGRSYNADGSQADAADLLFAELPNSFYVNFSKITYFDRGEERCIPQNSFICFRTDYFSYAIFADGTLQYRRCTSVTDDTSMRFGDCEMTYHDLLLALGIISPPKSVKAKNDTVTDGTEEAFPEAIEEVEELYIAETIDEPLEEVAEKVKVQRERPKREPQTSESGGEEAQIPEKPIKDRPIPTTPTRPNTGISDVGDGEPVGVRTDIWNRPDKHSGVQRDKVKGYVKPEVTLGELTAGVYHVDIPITKVTDPSNRIDLRKKISFEVYEIINPGESNEKKSLIYRTYKSGVETVVVGNGAVKPNTTYRVVASFTYSDEYDVETVEALMDDTITTKSRSELGALTLTNTDSGVVDIPVYHDKDLTIPDFRFTADSDREAMYGINQYEGMQIEVRNTVNPVEPKRKNTLLENKVRTIKLGGMADKWTVPALTANSKYEYRISIYDYFGEELMLTNPTGEFETCKSRPVGKIKVEGNKIQDVRVLVSVSDTDQTAIPTTEGGIDYDLYFVVAQEADEEWNPITKAEVNAYLSDSETGLNHHGIGYVKKFTGEEMEKLFDASSSFKMEQLITMNKLRLNTRYYVYMYMDYNLNNKEGDTRFGEICFDQFISASLDSLGRLIINVKTSEIEAHKLDLMYTVTPETNAKLVELLSRVDFKIVRSGGADPVCDAIMSLNSTSLDSFRQKNPTPMTKDAFSGTTVGDNYLKSSTEYGATAEAVAVYDGVEYPVNVQIVGGKFKTLKEPASVEVRNELLAAGTLRFDVKISDPDDPPEGSIIGNAGHKVVLNVYDKNAGKMVTSMRLDKNTEDYIPVEITNLGTNPRILLEFIAVEYNEGYTNATFVSNQILASLEIPQSVKLSGTLKLKELKKELGTSTPQFTATTVVTLDDPDRIMEGMQYYVVVEKNQVNVTDLYPESYTATSGDYVRGTMEKEIPFRQIQPNSTYKMSLYVRVNNQKLTLDTLEFTTEDEIINIDNAMEFIWYTYHYPEAKFAVTNDIVNIDLETDADGNYVTGSDGKYLYHECEDSYLPNTKAFPCPDGDRCPKRSECDGKTLAMGRHLDTFAGKIDFQGYRFDYSIVDSSASIFTRLDSSGELYNMVFNVRIMKALNEDAGISLYNFGNIHDIVVNYTGGNSCANTTIGLICRSNASSGIIDNFVIANQPDGGYMPLTAKHNMGMVCYVNYGKVQNGYVYGDEIIASVSNPTSTDLKIGSIVGYNQGTGRMENLYSLVNVIIPNPDTASDKKTMAKNYGAICGDSHLGRILNCYSIGQSYMIAPKDGKYVDYSQGPAAGNNQSGNKKMKNVYYWYDSSRYPQAGEKYNGSWSLYQTEIGLDTLHDYTWQQNLLGKAFNTSIVEVGYYPHLKYSEELPPQPYIEMPGRKSNLKVSLLSASFVGYDDAIYDEEGNVVGSLTEEDTDYHLKGIVNFRFSNPYNLDIVRIHVQDIDCELDVETIKSEDGYTTVQGTLCNPQKFQSQYEVNSVEYVDRGSIVTAEFAPKPQLFVDFYRPVSNADEWYYYVVSKPTENARIIQDIDFAGKAADRIRVTAEYDGKLIGGFSDIAVAASDDDNEVANLKKLKNITLKASANSRIDVFTKLGYTGQVNNLVIENLSFDNKVAGKPGKHAGFCYENYGDLSNVHFKNVSIDHMYGYLAAICVLQKETTTVTNCTVNGFYVHYNEPYNVSAAAKIGAITAEGTNAYIENCYARDVQITAEDLSDSAGVGGIAGTMSDSVLSSVYSEGTIRVRGLNVGGIVGYYSANAYSGAANGMISKTDVSTYQDMVGGIMGTARLSEAVYKKRTGYSGIALGNVTCKNPDAENVSYTIGTFQPNEVYLYGSQTQLMNGQEYNSNLTDPSTDAAHMLTAEEIRVPSVYVTKARMPATYDYTGVAEGKMPNLYYNGTMIPLPFQTGEDQWLPLVGKKEANNEITVRQVMKATGSVRNLIYVDINKPADKLIEVTGVTIEKLGYAYRQSESESLGYSRLVIEYDIEAEQPICKDSYDLTKIFYNVVDENGNVIESRYADYSSEPVIVPLTLYKEIHSVNNEDGSGTQYAWTTLFSGSANYGDYQNYKVKKDLDFKSVSATMSNVTNAKIGRLVGDYTGHDGATLRNLTVGSASAGKSMNLIFSISSELSQINFENIKMYHTGRDNAGVIGLSTANIRDIKINNVSVDTTDARTYVGFLAKMNGGSIENVIMDDVRIGESKKASNQVGGLVGRSSYKAFIKNVTANNIVVNGNQYTGGILGYSNRVSMESIHVTDAKVTATGTGGNIGGIAGYYYVGAEGAIGPHVWDISITGSSYEYDAEGYIKSSSCYVVNEKGGEYTGGIIGRMRCSQCGYEGGWDVNNNVLGKPRPISASNMVVRSSGNYVGGAFGTQIHAGNTYVTNTLVTSRAANGTPLIASGTTKSYIGGIMGYSDSYSAMAFAEKVKVDTVNNSYVGGAYGRSLYGSIYYTYVSGSKIVTDRRSTENINRVGGISGSAENQHNYSGVENTVIDAPNSSYVGGISGYATATINKCYYYATPQTDPNSDSYRTNAGTEFSACARPEFYIRGNENVGGIDGYRRSNNTQLSYSNANVIGTTNVGGLVGQYDNGFTATKTTTGYAIGKASAALKYNGFYGSVEATGGFAGGAIGINTMKNVTQATCKNVNVSEAVKNLGGRSKVVAAGDVNASGSDDEAAYTIGNLILAKTVSSNTAENAQAFCGNQAGFEGKANYWNLSATYAKFANGTDASNTKSNRANARLTYYFAGMKVGAKGSETALYNKQEGDKYVYYVWNKLEDGITTGNVFKFNDSTQSDYQNIRLVTNEDLKNGKLYASLKWREGSYYNNTMKNIYSLFFCKNPTAADVKAELDAMNKVVAGYKAYYQDKQILCHVRANEKKSGLISDVMTRRQGSLHLDLPIPKSLVTRRGISSTIYMSNAVSNETAVLTNQNLVLAYAVDVDKINIEFMEDVLKQGLSYEVRIGSEVIASGPVNNRVYTFAYDFKEAIHVVLSDGTTIRFMAEALRVPVMTKGNEYYYITGEGNIVHGTNVSDERVLEGNYLHLDSGNAINAKGDVVAIDTGEVLRHTEGITLTKTTSLLDFTTSGMLVHTYGGHSRVVDENGETLVTRDMQMLASVNGATGAVPLELENIKNAAILYDTSDTEHLIVLSINGRIMDLYGKIGDGFYVPEDFDNSNIVHMSHNLNTVVPYMLVEYANGGKVGVNFANGTYLFKQYEKPVKSFGAFIQEYLFGTKAERMEIASANYQKNQAIAEELNTVEELYNLIPETTWSEGGVNKEEIYGNSIGTAPVGIKETPVGQRFDISGIVSLEDGAALQDGTATGTLIGSGEGKDTSGTTHMEGDSRVMSENSTKVSGTMEVQNGLSAIDGNAVFTQDSLEKAREINGELVDADGNAAFAEGELYKNGDGIVNGSANVNGKSDSNGNSNADYRNESDDKAEDDNVKSGNGGSRGVEPHEESSQEITFTARPVPEETQTSEQTEAELFIDTTLQAREQALKNVEELQTEETADDCEVVDDEAVLSYESTLTIEDVKFGNLVTVYNQVTGRYEIVDMSKYLSAPNYISENYLTKIQDFSEVVGGDKTIGETDSDRVNGLILYISCATAILACVAFTMEYKKLHKKKNK